MASLCPFAWGASGRPFESGHSDKGKSKQDLPFLFSVFDIKNDFCV